MSVPLKTALIGLGKIGVKYAEDPKLTQHYKYASHHQVLADHPDFDCGAYFDLDPSIEGQTHKSIEQIARDYAPEVLVLATPPQGRLEIIREFKGLKAIIMEKPLAHDYVQAREIVAYCEKNDILLQINYWRRFDKTVIALKDELEYSGDLPQVIYMNYGWGLRNNAVHLIDQTRYLFGEILQARALSEPKTEASFPIKGDVNIDFQLTLECGAQLYAHALDFNAYREISVDIWLRAHRVELMQSGLVMRSSARENHRALEGAREVASDEAVLSKTGAGEAFYNLYDNLSQTLKSQAELLSDGHSALKNEEILDKILS